MPTTLYAPPKEAPTLQEIVNLGPPPPPPPPPPPNNDDEGGDPPNDDDLDP